jgi:isocitrate/isopropylmalate dehydrogenase
MSPTAIPATNGTTGQAPSGRPCYKIASIPGDGIGPEVISAGIKVLEKLASVLNTFDLDFTHFEWSSDYYKKHGRYLPDDALDQMRKFDAILFGSVGAPGMHSSIIWTPAPQLYHNTKHPNT